MKLQLSPWRFISLCLIVMTIGLGLLAMSSSGGALAQNDDGTPEAADNLSPVASIDSPTWTIDILLFEDPYALELRIPASPYANAPELRYIGMQVMFHNTSDQPLEVRPQDFRLHDSDGYDYPPASGASGSEPKLQSQIVQPGEQARGWIFFAVPVVSNDLELRVITPSTTLNLPVEETTRVIIPLPEEATPVDG